MSDEPAVTITNFQGRSLSDIHSYLSRQNRDAFLDEFKLKLGVDVSLNAKGGFDVFIPRNHEGPVDNGLLNKVETVLVNLQSYREDDAPVRRDQVQREINRVVSGELTPIFAQRSLQKAVALPGRTAALMEASAEVSKTMSEVAKRFVAKIKLPQIDPRTPNQGGYMEKLRDNDVTICIAPAGSGKTFLAVHAAVEMLAQGKVNRIVITRPAVEAGERLGFLPGDMKEKIDPYMKPVYKALMKCLADTDTLRGKDILKQGLECGVIEIGPLAFMRGDEFENAVAILDEGQNATHGQTKMFLTRIAQGGKLILVGDPEQTDLVPSSQSGLMHIADVFEQRDIAGIGVARMTQDDCVRHQLIGPMLRALQENPVPFNYDPYKNAGRYDAPQVEPKGTWENSSVPRPRMG